MIPFHDSASKFLKALWNFADCRYDCRRVEFPLGRNRLIQSESWADTGERDRLEVHGCDATCLNFVDF